MTKKDVLSIALILALAGVIGLFVSVVSGCSNKDEPTGRVDTLYFGYRDTLHTSRTDSIILDNGRLTHMQRANLKMMYWDKLSEGLAWTRWVPDDTLQHIFARAVELFEADGYLEFGVDERDTIHWRENERDTLYISPRFYTPRITGWVEWIGPGHDTTSAEAYHKFPVLWDSIPGHER